VAREDGPGDAAWVAEKAAGLRIFPDSEGVMNRSLLDLAGEGVSAPGVLAISQFTLLADARKGRRPSYYDAEAPEKARALYELFMEQIRKQGLPCEGGVFQAHMEVESVNDGPVTILLDSRKLF
jgi:D-tyrosyl-tRNA(Tyr) deacylase